MNKKILVVEDDLYFRELYEEVLRDAGFEVETCTNGEEGIQKLLQGGYDLVLLDVMMPKVDGIGVLTAINNTPPQVKNGPIILLTNLSDENLIKDAQSKGISSYLVKADLTPDQLVEAVNKFLNQPTERQK